jgi:hypothetical protein
MQCASSTANSAIGVRRRSARNRSFVKRSGATYSSRSSPDAIRAPTAVASSRARLESSRADGIPRAASASIWSFISAIRGDTTTVSPSSRSAGSW